MSGFAFRGGVGGCQSLTGLAPPWLLLGRTVASSPRVPGSGGRRPSFTDARLLEI